MKLDKIKFQNLDANEGMFFARELEFIKSKTYDILYPNYKAKTMIPVSGEAGSGAEIITYDQFDRVGIMKIIADYADDLPSSDVTGKQFSVRVKSLGGSYKYSMQEVRSAMFANRPLVDRKAKATRQSWEQQVNTIGWLADGSDKFAGMRGILYLENVTIASAVTGAWLTGPKTPAQIILDINTPINNQRDLTKGVEEPDMVLLPVLQYSHISNTPRSDNVDTTILTFVQNVNPTVTFDWVNELKSVNPAPSGGAATNVMITYKRDPDKLTLEIPQEYEQFPVQERNLAFVVPAHGRIAGVITYYPLSITLTEGI